MNGLEIGLCWGTLMQASLSELIDAAGRYGFPTLSVRPDMVLGTIAGGMPAAALRQRLRDAGVRVRVIDAITAGLPGGQPPVAQADGVVAGSPETCFELAEALEAPIVNICHYSDFAGGAFEICQAALANNPSSRRRSRCSRRNCAGCLWKPPPPGCGRRWMPGRRGEFSRTACRRPR